MLNCLIVNADILLEIIPGSCEVDDFSKYDKSRTEILNGAVFYSPREYPVDFINLELRRKNVPSEIGDNKGYTRIRNT